MPVPAEVLRRIVVDHALLSRLGPESPRAEWARTLKRAGVSDLDGLDGEPGERLAAVHAAMRSWPGGAGPSRAFALGWPTVAALGASLALTVLGLFVFQGGGGFFVLFATFPTIRMWQTARDTKRAGRPDPVHGARAATALRRFLACSFVAPAGDLLVENTPHRAYLELRLDEVARAARGTEGRLAELRALRARIADTNTRMGRTAEDVETRRLTTAIEEQEATRARVEGVRRLLAERLARFDAELERLRVVVERQVLSERVSRFTGPDTREAPAARVAAEVEVEVAEIEARVRELALETGNADARLRAVLEVVGVGAR